MAVSQSGIALPLASSRQVSTETAYAYPIPTRRRPWLSVRAEVSGLGNTPVAQTAMNAAPGLEPVMKDFGKQSSKFAEILGTISSLYGEISAERRAADEYLQKTAEESGRSTEDYERRALLFERSGEMVASSKLKEERVIMELELLQGEVLERDKGQLAADYLRRAQIFSKSAEIFASH